MVNKKEEMFMDKQMHLIVDELHPLFQAVSDEEMIEDHNDHGVFTRIFKSFDDKKYLLKWRVYFGTPETVKTIFEPIQLLN